jgi:hypothetical protein
MTKLLIIAFLALPLAGCGTVAAGLLGGAVGGAVVSDRYERGYGSYGPYDYPRYHRWHRRGW